MLVRILLICGLTFVFAFSAPAQENAREELSVMSSWMPLNARWIERRAPRTMLWRRMNAFAFRDLDRREREVARFRTAADWLDRRSYVRRTLEEILGPWPEKTPLKPRITKTIRRDGYRIELLVFESRPGFPVTAALYVPAGVAGRRPGILYIPGHSTLGFRADHYQQFCQNLVHQGFVVLAYDPIGQGERLQNIDPVTGKPFVDAKRVKYYKAHSYPGNQCYLSGVSIARYFIWDGIRGIDYLVSRPEVDGARIGVTGNSGGGNMTVFLAAVDDRVTVAVPSCWVTSYRRLLGIIGVQDAEQNIYHSTARGIDHADWLLARAPQPTLLLTTSHDFMPIQGARETAAEMRRAYTALGAPENFGRVEDDHGHGYTRKNLEAAYAFLMKHLGVSADASEKDYPLFRPEELRVTATGQVATSLHPETVFSLNRRETEPLLAKLAQARKDPAHPVKVAGRARRLSGYETPAADDDAVLRGGYKRAGYRIEKYALVGGADTAVPLILGIPPGDGRRPVVIYLHPDGKTAGAAPGGPIEKLVRRGYLVVAPDVAGIGETAPEIGRPNDYNVAFYTGLLSGHSVVGVQAADLARVIRWLQSEGRAQPDNIGLVAVGSMGPSAIHAAAFEPDIRWLVLERTPISYASMVMNRLYVFPTSCMVAGALTAYDLPDLLASAAPKKLALLHPVDQQAEPLSEAGIRAALQYPISVYGSQRLKIVPPAVSEEIADIVDWCAR